jgi:WD40 repeat protein
MSPHTTVLMHMHIQADMTQIAYAYTRTYISNINDVCIRRHHSASVYAVDFAPDSSGIFATGSKDCTIALWSIYADTVKNI